jgi:hypothetical protein
VHKRRTRIVIETHQVWLLRKHCVAAPTWCPECAKEVRMITPDEAAAIGCVNVRTIYSWVEAKRLHFTETAGSIQICFDSLSMNL